MNFVNKLLKVSKPARYAGGEQNSVIKSNSANLLKFCLIFPDIYEIGSSHIGYRLLYEVVNNSESVYCERFFAPWVDAKDVLGADAFVSLERKRPLKEFDVLGFSMHYEMCYPTVLAIIKHAGLQLKSEDRLENDPIIIGGGSCTFNPAPMMSFLDAMYVGEGDTGLTLILEGIKKLKDAGADKHEILVYLNSFAFMYVPQIDKHKRVKRDIFHGFSEWSGLKAPLVPLMPAIQDRVATEIARGCTAGCRFCQAGVIYRPVRERSADKIIHDACTQINATGWTEVSLLSLSTGDYSCLDELVINLNKRLMSQGVSLSTPSLRADSVSEELFKEISKVRKSGFTIAPEAGSQRMRQVINKNLSEDNIIDAVKAAAINDYNGVKLYFMIGLPFETDEDILGIASLAMKIKRAVKEVKRGSFDISVSVSHFVPKPHTPFQRLGQVDKLELERRMYMLKDELKRLKFKFKFHDTRMSAMEAVLSRGGEEIGQLLEYGAEHGFYLEAWDDFFDFNRWKEACEACGLSLEGVASKSYADDEKLPWSNIDTGVTDEFYSDELKKARQSIETEDCRDGACAACGVCDFETLQPVKASPSHSMQEIIHQEKQYEKYELTYSRLDEGRVLSALELSRIFIMGLRAAGVELKFTQGFNPQPKIALFLPLPVGIGGLKEKIVFEAVGLNVEQTVAKLNTILPVGLKVTEIKVTDTAKTGADFISTFQIGESLQEIVKSAIHTEEDFYERTAKNGELKKISMKDYLINFDGNIISLKATASGGFNLAEFFKSKGVAWEEFGIVRINVEMANFVG